MCRGGFRDGVLGDNRDAKFIVRAVGADTKARGPNGGRVRRPSPTGKGQRRRQAAGVTGGGAMILVIIRFRMVWARRL